MTEVRVSVTVSVDGYVAGPNQSVDNPMGEGTRDLHQWLFTNPAWREEHGFPALESAGEVETDDGLVIADMSGASAFVMGRGMFGGGPGPWNVEEPWDGWWGDEPPYHGPVFVLTSHAREPLVLGETTFTFVTDGIESAVAQAKAAAGDGYVLLAGGAHAIQQGFAAGLVDELQLSTSPLLVGAGERLLDHLGDPLPALELVRVINSPRATHTKYRVKSA